MHTANHLGQICQTLLAASEQDLLTQLLANQTNIPQTKTATPQGYQYVARITGTGKPLVGETLFLSPHPSDVSADFFPYLIDHLQKLGSNYSQLLLTRGEKGHEPSTSEQTVALRLTEELNSAQISGINVSFLTRQAGEYNIMDDKHYFPDGSLLEHLPELVERLKEHIRHNPPARLAIPSLYPDHPDHLATALAALNAVIQLKDEGFFKNHEKIEIITSDPEFGVALGQPWAVQEVEKILNNIAKTQSQPESAIKHFRYLCQMDPETGRIEPSPDITQQFAETGFCFDLPMAVPPIIIAATEEQHEKKMHALSQHETQILGKAYANLIPTADRVRGLQISNPKCTQDEATYHWAAGLYPISIPGVTVDSRNSLIDALPNSIVFQLQKM